MDTNTKGLTVEQLLSPRYKVIADYPGCPYDIGAILHVDGDGELFSPTLGYSWKLVRIMQISANKFPHLIKPLQWWGYRQPEEMPMYLKRDLENYGGILEGEPEIYVVKEHFKLHGRPGFDYCKDSFISVNGQASDYGYRAFLPATESDYIAYINQNKDNAL